MILQKWENGSEVIVDYRDPRPGNDVMLASHSGGTNYAEDCRLSLPEALASRPVYLQDSSTKKQQQAAIEESLS